MSDLETIYEAITDELALLFKAHARAGLQGKMCLYAINGEDPWRVQEQYRGFTFYFGPEEIPQAIAHIKQAYNNGERPNTALMLNPCIHEVGADGIKNLGTGCIWASAFALGVATLSDDQCERLDSLGVAYAHFARGDNAESGYKILGFLEKPLPVNDLHTTDIGHAAYDVSGVDSDEYYPYYLLSGLSYLSKHGSFMHAANSDIFADCATNANALLEQYTIRPQLLLDAQKCWNAYDRHATLYRKFGHDVVQLDTNLEFYKLCAQDFELFDATGPMKDQHGGSGEFEFVVEGMIPRGSITLLSATGGTGKSSIAHLLCVLAATNWRDDEEPKWLGQPINKEHCKGICVYFSGEDGPAIINARQELYDPEGRAQRVMFQRTDFRDEKGEEISFPQFMKRLHAMPDVPVMVIDPARKYLTGDENDAGVVSEFFEAIEEFAIQKNCAVIVVHHLAKGSKPQSAAEVVDELRGSQVFIDRPRIVIGMFRDGPHTIVGLGKCNIPPHLGMVTHERVFRRDPKKLQLVQLEGEAGIRGEYMSPEEIESLREMGHL